MKKTLKMGQQRHFEEYFVVYIIVTNLKQEWLLAFKNKIFEPFMCLDRTCWMRFGVVRLCWLVVCIHQSHSCSTFFSLPSRLLLSGTGTPVQPISKIVQIAISALPCQVIRVPWKGWQTEQNVLATTGCCLLCRVWCSVTVATRQQRHGRSGYQKPKSEIPSKGTWRHLTSLSTAMHVSTRVGMAGLLFAKPSHGTVMGPCHACDYLDVLMGKLDRQLVSYFQFRSRRHGVQGGTRASWLE